MKSKKSIKESRSPWRQLQLDFAHVKEETSELQSPVSEAKEKVYMNELQIHLDFPDFVA
jgi:hypothetical protein